MRNKSKLWILMLIISLLISQPITTKAETTRTLTDNQKEIANTLARICTDNWDTYGVLPSVCIAQAFVESTLGKNCSGNNLWGIRQGKEQYATLEDGVIRYLQVINNGYYENAPFLTDYRAQISEILAGGYCQPVGDYYEDATWIIENYGLAQYDQPLFEELNKRERKTLQNGEFYMQHNEQLPTNVIAVDTNVIPEGSAVCVYVDDVLYGIYDVVPAETNSHEIISINDINAQDATCSIVVYENAKG